MGIAPELSGLLLFQLLGSAFFSKFEIETPPLRTIFNWLVIDAITVGLYFLIGHYSMLFPFLIAVIGMIAHVSICKKEGIDPVKATPRKKYYKLREWEE